MNHSPRAFSLRMLVLTSVMTLKAVAIATKANRVQR